MKWKLARRSLTWPALFRRAFWQPLPADIAAVHAKTLEEVEAEDGVSMVSSWDDDRSLVVLPSESRLGVAKVGLTEGSRRRLHDEYLAISAIAAAEKGARAQSCVPRVLDYGPGVLWTERLSPLTVQTGSVPAQVLHSLIRVAARLDSAEQFDDTQCPACIRIAREATAVGLWHGDLTPWNLMSRDGAGRLVIIDWELAWPLAVVPVELLASAWDVRVRASRSKSSAVTEGWDVAAVCFDRYRKHRLAKQDGWADRVIVGDAQGWEHRYV